MSKLTKYEELKHGMRVTCKIKGEQQANAKLLLDDDYAFYICQNKKDGGYVDGNLGYKYSWYLCEENESIIDWDNNVTNLESVEEEPAKEFQSKKIKSIKVKNLIEYIDDTSLQVMLENHPEFFEIEHEPDKPKLLKRADGSLISEVAFGVETYQIRVLDNKYFVQAIQYEEYQKWLLMEGRVFLTQDIRLAQEKAKMLTKQVEIQFEIDRLNAESIDNKYWSIKYNDFKKKFEIYSFEVCGVTLPENYKMTCKTAETILAKFSQDEIKQYLGI